MNSSISPAELQRLQSEGCSVIDVREPIEHAAGHLPGAQLIPLDRLDGEAGRIARDKPVVVMCQSGRRGGVAQQKLRGLGFEDVRNLEGGIQAWKAAGLPVRQGEKRVLPLMQQVQIAIGSGVLAGVILSLLVHPGFIWLSAFFGAGLVFAGTTGWCGLAILMSKMPWNRVDEPPVGNTKSGPRAVSS